ncbi:hypothetical protein CFC21_028277 [Triticum aestivum]|uniref:DUF3615 domain-containing protein n=2 Tax=Triticum aestivum TaxID=4565 RepID=A0A9R1JE73_WHEAT|nr:uncharacterized protein LOC123048802 isoform X1 [Triticum aestivum]XP_044327765.1 uncharacterized protein LOC123048802 isoform X1 [Triticum aestivum]KAF7014261.1 hypothetical protein CFC21_028277 [Triticum aestivum]
MGSAVSSAIADAAVEFLHLDGQIVDEDDPHGLPLDQQQRHVQRFMDRLERKRRRNLVLYGPRSEGAQQSHRSPTCPDRPSPLQFEQPGCRVQGAELVSPMSCNRVGFRDEIWFHFNFLARRCLKKHNFCARGRVAPEPDTSDQYFFAELHYDRFGKPVVETCTILEKPICQFKGKCAFCKGSVGIWHPRNGGFLCGREGQKKEYCQMFMLSERPKKGPEEEPSSVPRLFDELPLAA